MDKKVFLVTGGNKGIGKEIVKQLASLGHLVYFSTRNVRAGKQALADLRSFGEVKLVSMDVNDRKSQEAAYAQIAEDSGYLDGLINNAGICTDYSAPSMVSQEALRLHFETNYYGPISVTQTMLPLLRKGSSKVIVNVSSALGSIALQGEESWPFYGVNLLAYNSSKTALNMFTVSLAKELRIEGFKVNSVNPGHIKTDLGGENAPGTVEEGAAISVRCALLENNTQTGLFLSKGGSVPW
ncbi:MAG: short-chain dehydrogenase [Bdellovibrionaceae bacterium]|nr:short-chain dehydrogenase [Pseudobdellovibrionaceae bacterium]|tara:strand:- start:34 stop:753 length:720 start_codon:yes stop_codon:yes gene_type:complete